jgi:hypothetical protein
VKPTSIIFLVVAVLLIIGGWIACSIAKDTAVLDGYDLFRTAEDGSNTVRRDIPEGIGKIELIFKNADVRIVGGAEESYAEFSNFREGLYTLSVAGQIFSFDDMPNISSILSFSGGYSFSGVRYLLRGGIFNSEPRQITIYLSPDSELKVVSVDCTSCTLEADNTAAKFDLIVKASKSASVSLKEYRTACALEVTAPNTELTFEGGYIDSLKLHTEKLNLNTNAVSISGIDVEAKSGTVSMRFPSAIRAYGFHVETSGRFLLCGEEEDVPYEKSPMISAIGTYSFIAGSADIELAEMTD